MTRSTPYLVEANRSKSHPILTDKWRGEDGCPLSVSELPGINRADIVAGERSMWRYRKAFPIDISEPISLGEGCTPLIRRSIGRYSCYLKLEWFSPTGSFKDRGASLMMSILKAKGIRELVIDSSGNSGAAVAAYGAAANIKVHVFVPSTTQPSKIAQIRAFGADVELVKGPRETSEKKAIAFSRSKQYASHNWNPFFLHGTKTLGYELWEDLEFRVPDVVIIPTGAGTNLLGCHLAFNELVRSGEIPRFPRIFAIQPENCCPIHRYFKSGAPLSPSGSWKPTIAEGASIANPVRLQEVVDAIRRSNGGTVSVSEREILSAIDALADLGLYVEPTSACALAGYRQLIEQRAIASHHTTVVILTGTGLKTLQLENRISNSPATD